MKGKIATNLIIALALSVLTNTTANAADDKKDQKRNDKRRALKMDDYGKMSIADQYKEAAHQKNMELMAEYEKLLKNPDIEGQQKAELKFRLAEKYFAEGKYYYFKEMQAFEKEYDKCFNTPGCDTEKLAANNKESSKWQKKSIRLYQSILDFYPQYARADQVLFFLGSALQQVNQDKKAVKQFRRLTKEYSSSRYLPDAYVNIGEHYFEQNNAFKALKAYEQATKYKTSPKYGFAMYKLAWCYYNVQDYNEAISNMKAVVSYSMEGVKKGNKQKVTLQEEALRDLVLFFADAGEMDDAYQYFTKLGKKELIIKMLKSLAKKYFEQGKFKQSIQTYRRLISENRNSPNAPDYYNEIIQAYQSLGRKDKTLEELKNLLKKYGKNSTWAKANSSNPEALRKATGHVEKGLRKVANNYHREAEKLGRGTAALDTYKYAEEAYRAYLDQFPTGKYIYNTRYGFGELLYTLGEYYSKKKSADPDGTQTKMYYSEAFTQYSAVVKIDPKGKYSQLCAENTMFTAREMVRQEDKEGKIKKRKSNTDIEPIELSEWERKLLEAMDNYASVFPKSKDTIDFLYESGELLFAKNRLDEASERYRRVISMKPKSKQATKAAEGIAEALAFRANSKTKSKSFDQAIKDYTSLRDTSRAFYEQKGLGSKKFKKEMYEYFELAYGKLVQISYDSSSKSDDDKRRAAAGYVDFSTTFPKSKIADSALNNAAVFYYETNNIADSMKTRRLLIDGYPNSKFYSEHIARLGYSYETIANFTEASTWYEKLYEVDPKHEFAKDSLFTAALFRQRLGQWEKAIEFKREFMKAFPDDDRAKLMGLDIANIYLENKEYDKAIGGFSSFYQKPPEGTGLKSEFYARLQHGLILKQKGDLKAANNHWKKTLTAYEKATKDGAANEDAGTLNLIIGEIKYYMAIQKHAGFNKIKIDGPKRSVSLNKVKKILSKQFTQKTNKQKDLLADFSEIVALNAGKWTLAAVVEIAKSYDNWSDTIQNSYVPEFDVEEQKDIYRMKMEDRAFPIREKAISFYTKALEEAYKINLYTEATAYSTRRLGELKPAEFTQLEEMVLDSNYLSTQTTKTRTFLDKVE